MSAVGDWYEMPGRKAHLVVIETDYHLYTLCGRRMERIDALRSVPHADKCQRCANLAHRAQSRWSLTHLQEIARFTKEKP